MSCYLIAANGQEITDEMVVGWEAALERDEWPTDWTNVSEVIDGRLPDTTG